MNAPFKVALEFGLARLGTALGARLLTPGHALILAYHNIVPDDLAPFGDQSLHLPLARFRAQLDHLARHCRVVPLAELLGPPPVAADRRLPVAITFDDAYAGAVRLGAAELARRGLPATIFVTPGFLGGRSFWWDALAGAHGLAPELRRHALEHLAGRDERVRRWGAEHGTPESAPPAVALGAAEPDLEAALADPGLTLASHTWGHPNLAALGPGELDDELGRPREWLRSRFGPRVLDWVSYPYGLASPAVEQAATRAGYAGGLAITGGRFRLADPAGFTRPRLNVPAGLSADGLALRTAGLIRR